MHPADQFEAFSTLVSGGNSVTEIAARFGISKTTVKKRLSLARVSPALMTLYREGQIDLAELAAFTVTEDHAEQERVWKEMPRWERSAHAIRRALTQQDIPATDKRVRLVTLAAYEAAGGAIKRDLFSDENEGTFLLDTALLDRLAREALEAEAEKLRAEGWNWVDCRPEFDYEARSHFRQLKPVPVSATPEQQEEIDRLTEEFEALQIAEDEDAACDRQQEIEERLYALENNYTDEQRASSGAIVTIAHHGCIEIECGLVARHSDEDAAVPAIPRTKAQPSGVPAALTESLTAQKTAIIAAELMNNANVALAGVVHTLVQRVFALDRAVYGADGSVQINASIPSLKAAKESDAVQALEQAHGKWQRLLPAGDAALWHWCLAQPQDVLFELLAYCASRTVNTVQQRHDAQDSQRLRHANALAAALGVNMPGWFKPTAENYFGKVGKKCILAAYGEATGKPAPSGWHTMKKAQLAAAAERELRETGWLPEALRIGAVMVDDQEEERPTEDAA
jgi:ParB family chromosome partitioning protein